MQYQLARLSTATWFIQLCGALRYPRLFMFIPLKISKFVKLCAVISMVHLLDIGWPFCRRLFFIQALISLRTKRLTKWKENLNTSELFKNIRISRFGKPITAVSRIDDSGTLHCPPGSALSKFEEQRSPMCFSFTLTFNIISPTT